MHYRLLLIVGLLPHEGGSERVVALVGGVAVLPCSFGPASSEGGEDVEWSRRVPGAAGPQVVFLYRDGCETFEMKSPDFEFRASLFLREVRRGNLSLRLSGVRLSDAGEYRCLRLPRDSRKVELLVVAAPDPRLLLAPAGGGRLAVRCEAGCWRPAPRVELLDHRGRRLPSEELRGGPGGAGGCVTVTHSAALQNVTGRLVCRVHQPEFDQTRTAEIFIQDVCLKSCLLPVVASAAVSAALCSLIFGLIVFFYKRKRFPGRRSRASDLSLSSKASEQKLLLDHQNQPTPPRGPTRTTGVTPKPAAPPGPKQTQKKKRSGHRRSQSFPVPPPPSGRLPPPPGGEGGEGGLRGWQSHGQHAGAGTTGRRRSLIHAAPPDSVSVS